MGKVFDLAIMMPTSAFGTSATIPLSSAANVNGVTYLSFAVAGAVGGDTISYSLLDPINGGSETGTATYNSSNLTLTNRTVSSTISSSFITASSGTLIQSAIRSADAAIVNISNNFTANQGFNQTTPVAPIHVGTASSGVTDSDPQVLVRRDVDNASSGSGHCFVDNSYISRSSAGATFGYNSFDARITHATSTNFDHYAAFQALPTFNIGATAANYYGTYCGAVLNTGTITNAHLHYAANITSTATVTAQYGYFCEALTAGATNYAFYSAGTTPSFFGGGVKGSTDGSNAGSSIIGEYVSATVPSTTATGVANGVNTNLTSISLSAGDWDIWGNLGTLPTGTMSAIVAAISSQSATLPTDFSGVTVLQLTFTSATRQSLAYPTIRVSLSASATYYAVAQISYGTSASIYGFLAARRRR